MFAVGLAMIVALAVALVPAWRHYNNSAPQPLPSLRAGVAAAQETSYRAPPKAAVKRLAAPAVAARQTRLPEVAARAPAGVEVRLTAAGGDCWLEVRSASAKGAIVYVGTLARNKSYEAAGQKLWVRFGAPQNVTLTVNGAVTAIPSGTLDVLITRSGVRASAA